MKFKRGFTLIELLVVIAIIGILSSVVLVSIVTIRYKAKNAVIKIEVKELVKLLEAEYSDTGSYENLQKDFAVPSTANCDTVGFLGNYRAEVVSLCQKILELAPDLNGNKFIMANNVDPVNKYSIMVSMWTTLSPNLYCVGSSGTYEGEVAFPQPGFPDPAVGCYWNP